MDESDGEDNRIGYVVEFSFVTQQITRTDGFFVLLHRIYKNL